MLQFFIFVCIFCHGISNGQLVTTQCKDCVCEVWSCQCPKGSNPDPKPNPDPNPQPQKPECRREFNELSEDRVLEEKQCLTSSSGRYLARLEEDGFLAVWERVGGQWSVKWSTKNQRYKPDESRQRPYSLVMVRGEGVKIWDGNGRVVWYTLTSKRKNIPVRMELLDKDGNLVIYDNRRDEMWSSQDGTIPDEFLDDTLTNGRLMVEKECMKYKKGATIFNRACLESDGNFVVFDRSSKVVWSTRDRSQKGIPPYKLIVEKNDLRLYDYNDKILWESHGPSEGLEPATLKLESGGRLKFEWPDWDDYNINGLGRKLP